MPKEVVVAVDASRSMTGVRFQKAKDAVHRVLESLGSNDRVKDSLKQYITNIFFNFFFYFLRRFCNACIVSQTVQMFRL